MMSHQKSSNDKNQGSGILKSVFALTMILIVSVSLLQAQGEDYETVGIRNYLPVFYKSLVDRQDFPLSWTHGNQGDFQTWQQKARNQVLESLLNPPPYGPFDAVILDEEDRGSYTARKVVFSVTGDSRVLALMLVPKSPGPHPAVLLLHDHGGKFDIGKEKVIEPFGVSSSKLNSAKSWASIYYGNHFIGDELAKRGYVCLAVDMLNWSDRGGAGADGQQALNSNFLHLGASYPGLIAFEDLRAAEFLAWAPEVDSTRIAAMGLSVGGFRTWQIAALSERIVAGVSVCWMSTCHGLMVPGNNQTKGQSAYTMLHPGLSQYLDYPDVASIACPKPMMFCNGSQDNLFPVASITDAYDTMHSVWDSQNAGDKLVTKLYPAPHEFNLDMQADAFPWLDSVLGHTATQVQQKPANRQESINLTVFPNPAVDEATVSYELFESGDVQGVLVDSAGKEIVILSEIYQGPGSYQFIIDTAGLLSSTYLIRVMINGEVATRTLVVLNS